MTDVSAYRLMTLSLALSEKDMNKYIFSDHTCFATVLPRFRAIQMYERSAKTSRRFIHVFRNFFTAATHTILEVEQHV